MTGLVSDPDGSLYGALDSGGTGAQGLVYEPKRKKKAARGYDYQVVFPGPLWPDDHFLVGSSGKARRDGVVDRETSAV